MIQFYSPEILKDKSLPEEESLHCCRVLRMKEGDEIFVVDGKGSRYLCEITDAHPKHTQLRIKEVETSGKAPFDITLAVAPTKNSDRMEWMVEKCVELGVNKIIFIRCNHSERKAIRRDRLEKIAVSAMKQSLKTIKPEITEIENFNDFIKESPVIKNKFIAYCSDEYPREELVKMLQPCGDVLIIIGPEGDFTTEEVKMAVEKGFVPVTLGDFRLRTETAAIYSIAAVRIINTLERK